MPLPPEVSRLLTHLGENDDLLPPGLRAELAEVQRRQRHGLFTSAHALPARPRRARTGACLKMTLKALREFGLFGTALACLVAAGWIVAVPLGLAVAAAGCLYLEDRTERNGRSGRGEM